MIQNYLKIDVKIKMSLVKQTLKTLLCGSLPVYYQSKILISESRNSSVVQQILL